MNRYIHIQGYYKSADSLFGTVPSDCIVLVTSYSDFDIEVGDVLSFRGSTLNIIGITNTVFKHSIQTLSKGYNGFLLVKSNEDSQDFIKMVLTEVTRFNQTNYDTKMWILSKEAFRNKQLGDILGRLS